MTDNRLYQVALKLLEHVGPLRARKLVSYCGGVQRVFESSVKELSEIPEMGPLLARKLNRHAALTLAEKELKLIDAAGIQTYFYLDEDYPCRLKHCADAPVLLYGKGYIKPNQQRVVSIIGTRKCSDYGIRFTDRLVEALAPYNVLVVSGLAYGIDTQSHRAAVANNLPTIGVLGHSLDRIYPGANAALAKKMLEKGGLLSEFEFGTGPDRENFPQRNRVVAGMSDATIVIESPLKGGSIITAKMAAGYHRDVFAVPGDVDAINSGGCHMLIKTNQASLIESAEDLVYQMGWEKQSQTKHIQKQIFLDLNDDEQSLFHLLKTRGKQSIDTLSIESGLPMSKTSIILLEMEFKGVVRSLPGKMFSLN